MGECGEMMGTNYRNKSTNKALVCQSRPIIRRSGKGGLAADSQTSTGSHRSSNPNPASNPIRVAKRGWDYERNANGIFMAFFTHFFGAHPLVKAWQTFGE